MSLVPIPAAVLAAVAPPRAAAPSVRPSPSRRPPKMDARQAWAAWQEGDPSAGVEFLARLSPWIEGTAAQLLRQRWPAGAQRRGLVDLQRRLGHQLEVLAGGEPVSHLGALDAARTTVAAEVRRPPTAGAS